MKNKLNNTFLAGENLIAKTIDRPDIIFKRGSGCTLIDENGKSYLDFFNGHGVLPLGYGNKKIERAIKKQIHNLIHTGNHYYNISQVLLAEKIIQNSFAEKIFFANSGAEITDLAIKLARKYGRQYHSDQCTEIITFENSFHGRTYGAISATNQEKYSRNMHPMLPGFIKVKYNDTDDLIGKLSDKICAVLIEPILGDGGIVPAKPEFMQILRKLCNEKNILLIFDEIQTGMFRTCNTFAYQHYKTVPDVILLGKCIGGGLPLSVLGTTAKIASVMKVNDHGSTFGGNPAACSAAVELINHLNKQKNILHMKKTSHILKMSLINLQKKFPEIIIEIRGMGFMLGIKIFDRFNISELHKMLLENGLITSVVVDNTLRLLPMYISTKKEIKKAENILTQVFEKIKTDFNRL